jgi:hypothetical protein
MIAATQKGHHSCGSLSPILSIVMSIFVIALSVPALAEEPTTTAASESLTVTHKPKVFERLWKVYPNKQDKAGAVKAWNDLHISDEDLDKMRAAYPRWKFSADWAREKGKHVPTLATFLNERMWEKEPPPPAPMPPIRLAEISSFLLQPLYLAPRLAYAIAGSVVGGLIWPVSHPTAQKVWDSSLGAPWVWHDFIAPESEG